MIEPQQKRNNSFFPRPEIKKILHKATAKDRALTLANHVADLNMGEATRLTTNEFENLVTSFQSSREIKVYNRIKEVDKCVRNVLPYLNQLRLIYHENVAYLWGCYNMAFTITVFEKILNKHVPLESNEQGFEAMIFPDGGQINMGCNSNGKIEIGFRPTNILADIISRNNTGSMPHNALPDMINYYKKISEEGAIELKTCVTAVKDYLIREEAEINVYWRKIREIEDNMRKKGIPFEHGNNIDYNFTKSASLNSYDTTFEYPSYDDLPLNEIQYQEFSKKYLL
jgi:hypothetical protein